VHFYDAFRRYSITIRSYMCDDCILLFLFFLLTSQTHNPQSRWYRVEIFLSLYLYISCWISHIGCIPKLQAWPYCVQYIPVRLWNTQVWGRELHNIIYINIHCLYMTASGSTKLSLFCIILYVIYLLHTPYTCESWMYYSRQQVDVYLYKSYIMLK